MEIHESSGLYNVFLFQKVILVNTSVVYQLRWPNLPMALGVEAFKAAGRHLGGRWPGRPGKFMHSISLANIRPYYHLPSGYFNIAMENPWNKWRFLAGKIIYNWAMVSMAMLNNQRITSNIP